MVIRNVLAELRGGDLLAPVDVAVPSSFTGVTVRRKLAAAGLAGVRFSALPQLIADRAAGELAAVGRRPLTSAQRRAAARAVLVGGSGALADAARRSARTVDVVAGLFAELDDLEADDATLALLAASAGWPAELAALYRSYTVATAEMARPGEMVDAAGRADRDTPLVIYLPRRLTVGELRFCRALAARGLLRVVLGFTGEVAADAEAALIRDALAAGPPQPVATAAPGVQAQALPDAEEEVRYAVRRILAHLEAGSALRVERTGITYRAPVPYASLITEQLSAAGLPHHVPRQRTLAQSVAGRTLLALLSLPREDWSRVAVLDLLHDAPIRDGSGSAGRIPVARWQRLAREAGVTRGLEQWETKLAALALRLEADADPQTREQAGERASAARSLAAFVTSLANRIEAVERSLTWADAASATAAALAHYLGGPQAAASWGWRPGAPRDQEVAARCDVERAAYEQVTAILESLGGIDTDRVPLSAEALREVLGQELSGQVTEASGVGRGVLVGPLWDFAGANLDLLVVVGVTEGLYPPRGGEHPLLRDDVRAQAGLRTLADRRSGERRDHLAAIMAAPVVTLTHPTADTRGQRPAEPAPWLLELTQPYRRSREQRETGPASFAAAICDPSLPAATGSEYDVRLVMQAAPAGPSHPLAAAVPALGRGLAAAQERAAGQFGPWTGALTPPLAEPVTARLDRPLSATSLQDYAECPFRYFLSKVLDVQVSLDPDEERHDPRARGSAVHAVLEALVRAAIDANKPPNEPWTAAEHARAQEMLARRAAQVAAEGKAGRPAVWEVLLTRWRRQLRRVLLTDDAYRAAAQARPLAAEHGFGRDGDSKPPLVVDLPGGEVELRGSVDRIDQTAAGQLVVIDYKTGKSDSYAAFPKEDAASADADYTDQGRRLQLPLYALAARRDYAGAAPVWAYYWFVDEGAARRGGPITATDEQRFRDVLGVITAGIRDGGFPARPGDYDPYFRTFGTCRWCPYDRVCSQERGELWQRVRTSPRARRYAALAEPPAEES